MKKLSVYLLLPLFLFTLILVPVHARTVHARSDKDMSFNKAICDLKMAERKLWIDHVLWTRSFIVSDLASLQDKEAVLERLLKNQDDIGASIKPYYGEEAGNKLAALLREHISLAGQVVNAVATGNNVALEKYNKLWYENADQIAAFLSSANPHYSEQALKDMLYTHLQLIKDQVTARLNKNWQADIEAFDKGEDHMIMFADMLTDGIIKQFPQKFQ